MKEEIEITPLQIANAINNLFLEKDDLFVKLERSKKEIKRLEIIEEKYKDCKLYIKDYKDELEEEKRINKENLKLIDQLQDRIDKAIEKLKEHKHDLDYEPWSEYKISGNIVFDLVNILKGSDNE